jgi:hypothetical protein
MADPQKYRDEAVRLRREAETIHDHVDLATQYEKLAERLAEMHKGSVP